MSTRKPHNDLAGYVCELKSRHPKLPGHFVILDRQRGADFDLSTTRYAVCHFSGDSRGGYIDFKSLPSARALMKDMAAGSDAGDFGQHANQTTEPSTV